MLVAWQCEDLVEHDLPSRLEDAVLAAEHVLGDTEEVPRRHRIQFGLYLRAQEGAHGAVGQAHDGPADARSAERPFAVRTVCEQFDGQAALPFGARIHAPLPVPPLASDEFAGQHEVACANLTAVGLVLVHVEQERFGQPVDAAVPGAGGDVGGELLDDRGRLSPAGLALEGGDEAAGVHERVGVRVFGGLREVVGVQQVADLLAQVAAVLGSDAVEHDAVGEPFDGFFRPPDDDFHVLGDGWQAVAQIVELVAAVVVDGADAVARAVADDFRGEAAEGVVFVGCQAGDRGRQRFEECHGSSIILCSGSSPGRRVLVTAPCRARVAATSGLMSTSDPSLFQPNAPSTPILRTVAPATA